MLWKKLETLDVKFTFTMNGDHTRCAFSNSQELPDNIVSWRAPIQEEKFFVIKSTCYKSVGFINFLV